MMCPGAPAPEDLPTMEVFDALAILAGVITLAMSVAFKKTPRTRLYYLAGGVAYILLGLWGPEGVSLELRIVIIAIPVIAVLYGLVSLSEKHP